MARDLLLGKTPRDWSMGAFPFTSEDRRREMAQDVLAHVEAGKLAKVIEDESQQNFRSSLDLHARGRLPAADRKAFGRFLKKWHEMRDARAGSYRGEDYVALVNLRDENRRHGRRFAELAARPASASAESSPPTPTTTQGKHDVSAALGLAGVTAAVIWLNRNRK